MTFVGLILAAMFLSQNGVFSDFVIKDQVSLGSRMVAYIDRNTEPTDYILLWGAETAVNFLSNWLRPTRFVYQYPLYSAQFPLQEDYCAEFLQELDLNRPKLIIDTKNPATPIDAFGSNTLQYVEWLQFFHENYQEVTTIGEWVVYQHVGIDG